MQNTVQKLLINFTAGGKSFHFTESSAAYNGKFGFQMYSIEEVVKNKMSQRSMVHWGLGMYNNATFPQFFLGPVHIMQPISFWRPWSWIGVGGFQCFPPGCRRKLFVCLRQLDVIFAFSLKDRSTSFPPSITAPSARFPKTWNFALFASLKFSTYPSVMKSWQILTTGKWINLFLNIDT